MNPYRILVTGSRNWQQPNRIYKVLDEFVSGITNVNRMISIVHGNSGNVDLIADSYAQHQGWKTEKYNAQWAQYGRAAGPIRNSQMVQTKPDICLAFIKDHSKGATNCAELSNNADIVTYYFYDCQCHPENRELG